MGIGEVSSINNSSYIGQGSQIKTAPTAGAANIVAPIETSESINKNYSSSDSVSTASKAESEKENGKDETKATGMTSSLKDAVSKINAAGQNCEAVFGIHEATNRVTIKMVDKETKKTVKEFPAEETLDLIAKAWELAGIMIDEKG